MDKLTKSAKAFERLLKTEYSFKAGHKNKLISLKINFMKEDFFHLVGLHKLRDIEKLNDPSFSKPKIFDAVADGAITYDELQKSVFFDEIDSRISCFCKLEELLDKEDLIFRYYKNKVKGSGISADYLLFFDDDLPNLCFFLTYRSNKKGFLCGSSFFAAEDNRHIIGQPKFKVLYKSKKYIDTDEKIVLLNRIKPNGFGK